MDLPSAYENNVTLDEMVALTQCEACELFDYDENTITIAGYSLCGDCAHEDHDFLTTT